MSSPFELLQSAVKMIINNVLLVHPATKPEECARYAGKNCQSDKEIVFIVYHSSQVCFAYKAIGLMSSKTIL
jgi:hypothetical protein